MAEYQAGTPHFLADDSFIRNYEIIREVWYRRGSVKSACGHFAINRNQYYALQDKFIMHGVIGLFPDIRVRSIPSKVEHLILLAIKARPSLTLQAILRIGEAVPVVKNDITIPIISDTLASHGLNKSAAHGDAWFWSRIQRTLREQHRAKSQKILPRDCKQRKKTFFQYDDICQRRLELLRDLFYNHKLKKKDACLRYGISLASFNRLVKAYRQFGPWAIISANAPGKEGFSKETELAILLKKLQYPTLSAQQMVTEMKLKCSRFTINRIFTCWGVADRNFTPITLDHYCLQQPSVEDEKFEKSEKISAYNLLPAETLLKSRRINRHFQIICRKMQMRDFHLTDPGPFLLAPFLNDFGIVQAMETYGPISLRGKEVGSIALLNVFRILAGYPCINSLYTNKERSVAMASGIGMYGTTSRYYKDTLAFKFKHVHKLRHDLMLRAKEMGLISGEKVAFDFHFKEYFGKKPEEKGFGKGPDKAGNLVPGYRPHVAWDLDANTILSMSFFHGGVRAPTIIEKYCEQHIFPIFSPEAIREIYMDSEYTKEGVLAYFKQVKCKNGDVFLCLKKNPQIKKLIAPALSDDIGWEPLDDTDECKTIETVLPKTGLPLKIIILREIRTKENERCFGSTRMDVSGKELLTKYRYRWLIENGLKDLVHSYFFDEMYGNDPEKNEFEFYCVMVARLAYEYFIKELGGRHYHHEDGNKTTLGKMRDLLFAKHNFTLSQNPNGNFVLTLLDSSGNSLEKSVARMLETRLAQGKNKVLWWGNKGVLLKFDNQFEFKKK